MINKLGKSVHKTLVSQFHIPLVNKLSQHEIMRVLDR